MAFMERDTQIPQIQLEGFPSKPFFANNNSEIRDQEIIDIAVTIVDSVLPQKFGSSGLHYYSFIRRERFLNCILRHYQLAKVMPTQLQLEIILENVYAHSYSEREPARHNRAGGGFEKKSFSEAPEKGISLWMIFFVLAIVMAIVKAIKNS